MVFQKEYSISWILLVVLFFFAIVNGTELKLLAKLNDEIPKFGENKYGETKTKEEKKTNLEQLADKVINGSRDEKQTNKQCFCKCFWQQKKKIQSKIHKHFLSPVDVYINREYYIENYLQKHNSTYTSDPRINLQKFPMRYLIAHPYYFDYHQPLQWVTEKKITYFEQDFRHLLRYTQQSTAFTTNDIPKEEDWIYYMMFLPKIKFYHEVFRQIHSEYAVVPRQYQKLCEILSDYVDAVIKCSRDDKNDPKQYLFTIIGEEIFRIFTWPKNSCSYQPQGSPQQSYIKICNSYHLCGHTKLPCSSKVNHLCRLDADRNIYVLIWFMIIYMLLIDMYQMTHQEGERYAFLTNIITDCFYVIWAIFFVFSVRFWSQIANTYYLNHRIWPFKK